MKQLPKLTNKQEDILELLYRFRFLDRIQIQALMGHNDYKRINIWLKDLREKHYVEWIYSTHFLEKTKPGIYYLGINGIRLLKQQTVTVATDSDQGTEAKQRPAYPLTELRKRYRESSRSESFKTHSWLVAASCIALQAQTTPQLSYDCYTPADFIPKGRDYHFLATSDTIAPPDLCIVKDEDITKGETKSNVTTNYLLYIFDPGFPHYRIRYQLKQYVQYLIDDEWESGKNDPPPILLFVCPRVTDLIYAKRKTRKLLIDEYYEVRDIPKNMHLRFTTAAQLKEHGITAPIWEEGRKLYSV